MRPDPYTGLLPPVGHYPEHYPLQDSNLRPARLEGGCSIG